jgi:FKBP-type peptidyl-prolyl cis-trans isomerase
MNRLAWCFVLIAPACFVGCAPEKPAAIPPARDEATVRREWLYGPRATAADIVWRTSGLGIRLLAPGEGEAPKPTDRVRVHFVCALKDGKVVEDSRARGQPGEFVVSRLISGWAEGMTALKPGGRAEFFIPPSLGYGNRGNASIPAGSGLIFDVELLAVVPETIPPKKS